MAAQTYSPCYVLLWCCVAFSVLHDNDARTMVSTAVKSAAASLFPSRTSRAEASALLDLRYALHLRDDEWLETADPCLMWVGVQCEEGHVVGLELSGLKCRPVQVAHFSSSMIALQRLPLLRSLNASGFTFSGSLPSWIGDLKSLEILDVSLGSLSGVIPSSVGLLSNLRSLSLAANNLTGCIPSTVAHLSSLRFMDLSVNQLHGRIPKSIASLRQLEVLNLSHNQLEGEIPCAFSRLLCLQSLLLSSNRLSGSIPLEVGRLSSLSVLDLGSNTLSGVIPPELGGLKQLTTLILKNNALSGSIPGEIANCSQLQHLVLDGNELRGNLPCTVGKLQHLVVLSLSRNQLFGILSADTGYLRKLEKMILANNSFYGSLPIGLVQAKMLHVLDVSHNYFDGNVPRLFQKSGLVVVRGNCFSNLTLGSQRTTLDCRNFIFGGETDFFGRTAYELTSSLPISNSSSHHSSHVGAILGGVFGGLGFVAIVAVLVFYLLMHEWKMEIQRKERLAALAKPTESIPSGGRSIRSTSMKPVGGRAINMSRLGEAFSYAQLKAATGNFDLSNLIMAGHTGDLYKGRINGNVLVVVKRIELARYKKDWYVSELELFSKAFHARLVPLLGHCLDQDDEKLLVYKYMPNGDLAYSLHRKDSPSRPEDVLQSLDWITRLKIAIGVAEGLVYLHHECSPALVHRDIKASSILLDDKFEVRLGSLSESCTSEGEQHSSIIARLLRLSRSSDQGDTGSPVATLSYDVFCFGKVLLELVSGKLGISSSIDPGAEAWLDWALPLIDVHDRELLAKLMDPSLIVDEDLVEEVWAVAIIAKSCLNPKSSRRPNMKHILKALENPQKVVRHDHSGPMKSRHSSHGSWNSSLFGGWRHFSSDNLFGAQGSLREEQSREMAPKAIPTVVEHSRRPGSSEIVPVPTTPLDSDLEPEGTGGVETNEADFAGRSEPPRQGSPT